MVCLRSRSGGPTAVGGAPDPAPGKPIRAAQSLLPICPSHVRQQRHDRSGPGSERDPVEFLDQLCAQLEVALEYVAEAVWFDELEIDGTKIHQHRLGPHDTPPELPEVRAALLATLPMVHLPQILVDVDAKVRF